MIYNKLKYFLYFLIKIDLILTRTWRYDLSTLNENLQQTEIDSLVESTETIKIIWGY